MSDLLLAREFAKADYQAWHKLAQRTIGTKDFDATLTHKTADGLKIAPLYGCAADAEIIAGKRGAAPWQVIQRIDHPDPAYANTLALTDLENGATGLSLVLAGAPSARGFGLEIKSLSDLERVLEGIFIDGIALKLEAGGFSLGTAACLIALAENNSLSLRDLDLNLGLDPISAFGMRGRFPQDYANIGARMGDVAHALQKRDFNGMIANADGRVWHNAGASEAQELAIVLSLAVTYLRDMTSAGVPLDWAVSRIAAVLAADADQFMTIAKIRALRLLWARVLEACHVADKPLHIHCETAWRMMAGLDVHVNMLRTTMACFSAGAGEADSITVLPFTSPLGLPDEMARRIARNTQSVLLEEAHIARVMDPAAGAGGLEELTEGLAKSAWGLFQKIEAGGGISDTVKSGKIQTDIAKAHEARAKALEGGRDVLIGVTLFPNKDDAPVRVLDVQPNDGSLPQDTPADLPPPGNGEQFDAMIAMAKEGATPAALTAMGRGEVLEVQALPQTRLAEPYEEGANA